MMRILALVGFVALLAGADYAQARPSFDCNKAGTPSEFAICDSAELSALDRALADAYNAARKAANRREARQIRSEQRRWLRQRNRCRDDVACLSEAMRSRIIALGFEPPIASGNDDRQSPQAEDASGEVASGAGISGLWHAEFQCGRGNRKKPARMELFVSSAFENLVVMRHFEDSRRAGRVREALLRLPARIDGRMRPLERIFTTRGWGAKPFTLAYDAAADRLRANFTNCDTIAFRRVPATKDPASFLGNWEGSFQACRSGETTAAISIEQISDDRVLIDIEHRRDDRFAGRAILFGDVAPDRNAVATKLLYAGLPLRNGDKSTDPVRFRGLVLEHDAGQGILLGSTDHCAYAEFWRKGAESVAGAERNTFTGEWEGTANCAGQDVPIGLTLENAGRERLSGVAEYLPPGAINNGATRVKILGEIDPDSGALRLVTGEALASGVSRFRPGSLRLESSADGTEISGASEGGSCEDIRMVRVSPEAPSRRPTMSVENGGLFYMHRRPRDRCEAVAVWVERFEKEFPDLSLRHTTLGKVYPKLVLLFADNDFVPVFGAPFDQIAFEKRREAAREIKRICLQDPFMRERFQGFSQIERALRQDPNRPLTSFGIPAIFSHIRQTRILRHQIGSEFARIDDQITLKEADRILSPLTREIRRGTDKLWPSEVDAAQSQIKDTLAALALRDVEAEYADTQAIADPVARLEAIKRALRNLLDANRYLERSVSSSLKSRYHGDQKQLAPSLVESELAGIEALQPTFEDLASLEAKTTALEPTLKLFVPEVADPFRKRIEARRDHIVDKLVEQSLAELKSYDSSAEGLAKSARWPERFDGPLASYKQSSKYLRAMDQYREHRQKLLGEALPRFEAELEKLTNDSGADGVDKLMKRYLSWKGDTDLPIALEYQFLKELNE